MGEQSRWKRLVVGALACAAACVPVAWAQEAAGQPGQEIEWIQGPGEGPLGDVAKIQVPEGYRFTAAKGTKVFLELTENPVSGQELGILIPMDLSQNEWFLCFEFDPVGYVKDDEKNSLDAAALLKNLTEGTESSNKFRKQRGWHEIHLRGWEKPPFYNPTTNNLEWATRVYSDTGESVNYSTRLLGRGGVMSADLIVNPEKLSGTVEAYKTILGGFTFTPGHRYEEFRAGDAVAKYGLTALIAGGAGAVALKTGLLAKFWKLIVVAVLALVGFFRKIFGRLFSRKDETLAPPPEEGQGTGP